MVTLTRSFSSITKKKILVVGDLMLDTYTIGKAHRISPEAPVAVLHVSKEEYRAGGAGNVALNLISMGADVVLLGRVGDDIPGDRLLRALVEEGIETSAVFRQPQYTTIVKNRVIAENQQIVRIDYEQTALLPLELEQTIIKNLPVLCADIDLIALSDYGKGFLSASLLQALISLGRKKSIPIIADPKGSDFSKYKGVNLIKPNAKEAYAAANLSHSAPMSEASRRVLDATLADVLMITRSESGISLFHQNGNEENFSVRVREVKDVTGAGDTVLAMVSCALASGLSVQDAARLSNIAAGIAIEKFGCARVSLSEVARRLLEDDTDNKVFDDDHLFALKEATKSRACCLLELTGINILTPTLFKSIKQLSNESQGDLIVSIRDESPDEEFIDLLASLHDVNFVILNKSSTEHLRAQLNLETAYLSDGITLTKL